MLDTTVGHGSACFLCAKSMHTPLESRHTAVFALSVSRSRFELYDAAVSGAAAPARAAHSGYAVGYSLGGGFRLGCWIRWYPLFLLGCCFEVYDAVLALSADCVHTPLCIRVAVVLFSTKPWAFLFFCFIYFCVRRSTALSFWFGRQCESIKVHGTIYYNTTRNISESSIRRYLLSFVAVQIWLLFRIVQCCGIWHGCARSPALSLLMGCTRPCTLVKLLDTAVPAPFFGLLFEWYDTAVSGRRVLSLSQLIACTRCCVFGVLVTAVSDLSLMF